MSNSNNKYQCRVLGVLAALWGLWLGLTRMQILTEGHKKQQLFTLKNLLLCPTVPSYPDCPGSSSGNGARQALLAICGCSCCVEHIIATHVLGCAATITHGIALEATVLAKPHTFLAKGTGGAIR